MCLGCRGDRSWKRNHCGTTACDLVNRCKSTYKCRQCEGNNYFLYLVQPNTQAIGNLLIIYAQVLAESYRQWNGNITTHRLSRCLQIRSWQIHSLSNIQIRILSGHRIHFPPNTGNRKAQKLTEKSFKRGSIRRDCANLPHSYKRMIPTHNSP